MSTYANTELRPDKRVMCGGIYKSRLWLRVIHWPGGGSSGSSSIGGGAGGSGGGGGDGDGDGEAFVATTSSVLLIRF